MMTVPATSTRTGCCSVRDTGDRPQDRRADLRGRWRLAGIAL